MTPLPRRTILATAVLVVGVAVWAVVAWAFVERELRVVMDAGGPTGAWSAWWRRTGEGEYRGRWAEQIAHGRASLPLEIEPSGAPRDPNGEKFNYELWLYQVDPIASRYPDLDLKGAIRTLPAESRQGPWLNFEQGPGVVYSGNTRGLLRLEAPPGGVVVAMAKVPRGGPVTLRYAGQELTLDLYSPTIERVEVRLDDPHWSSAGQLVVEEPLPRYAFEDLQLAWQGDPDPRAETAEVVVSMFGLELARRVLGTSGPARHVERAPPQPVEPAETPPVNPDAVEPTAESGATPRPEPSVPPTPAQVVPPRVWHVLRLEGATGIPAAIHLAGSAVGVGIVLAGAWLVRRAKGLASGRRWACSGAIWSVVALGLVVLTAVTVARRSPLFITSDGVVYIDGAVGLVEHGTFERFAPYKAPGMTFLTAFGMWVAADFERGVRWIHAGCTIAASVLAWGTARRLVGAWAGPIASLLVGCCPMTLTYQAYLLRECSSIAILCGVVHALALRHPGVMGQPARPLASAALLGVLAGAGALLRENLQALVLLVPALVMLLDPPGMPWRRRAAGAGLALALSLVLVGPYVVHMKRAHGYFGIVTPKLEYNRAIAAYQNGLVDFADAVLFEHDLYRESTARATTNGSFGGRLTEYDFVVRSLEGAMGRGARTTIDEVPPESVPREAAKPTVVLDRVRRNERIYKAIVDEAIARQPARALLTAARSLGIQLGLVVVYDPVAAANEWYARPLRGEAFAYATNLHLDLPAMTAAQPGLVTPRTEQVIRAAERSTRPLTTGGARGSGLPGMGVGTWFNEVFWVWRLIKPAVGLAALLGAAAALIGIRHAGGTTRALAACAVVLLLQAVSASVVVMTPVDRFGVPLLALQVPLALFGVSRLARGRSGAGSPTSAAAPGSGCPRPPAGTPDPP